MVNEEIVTLQIFNMSNQMFNIRYPNQRTIKVTLHKNEILKKSLRINKKPPRLEREDALKDFKSTF